MNPAPAARTPSMPQVSEPLPGLLRVRLPLPLALDHINVWLLADDDGWTLVDTGFGNEATRAAWEELERSVLGGRPLRRVVCTHCHPDHIGLAGWMQERWGAPLWTTRTEWLQARMVTLDSLEATEANWRRFHLRAGSSGAALESVVRQSGSYRRVVSAVPPAYRRIRDGEELRIGAQRWRVVVGTGHSPEHACLHAPELGVLIAGDQVLPHISPNVAVWPNEPEAEPLGDFLASLATLRRLRDDVVVLPSHGEPFVGLHRRLDELAAHHRERLDVVLAACAEPRTAYEVTLALFPRALDAHQTTFAVGESLAHLNHLVAVGLLARDPRPGAPDRFVRRALPAVSG